MVTECLYASSLGQVCRNLLSDTVNIYCREKVRRLRKVVAMADYRKMKSRYQHGFASVFWMRYVAKWISALGSLDFVKT